MHSHPLPISAQAAAIIETRRREVTATLDSIVAEHPSITLELGCGHGHFLTAYAEAHPDQYCVGIDRQGTRIGRSLRKQDRAGLPNLRFVRADVHQFLECLPKELVLACILVLFPDPWPKKRHHKNRLLGRRNLDHLAEHSRPETDLFLRSDDFDYLDWVEANIVDHPDWQVDPDRPWPFDLETVFQKKAEAWRSLTAIRSDRARAEARPGTEPVEQPRPR